MGRILIGNVRHQLANNLTTNENGKYALDANQGKILDDKKINVSDISNNAITTVPNKVLDARMGKTLMDKYDELNRNKVENTVVNNIIKAGNILSNALIVDTTSAYSEINYSKYAVMSGTTANMPTNCAWGMRETLYINQNAILVKIVGIKTDGATTCVWINAYNTGAWRGWQEH